MKDGFVKTMLASSVGTLISLVAIFIISMIGFIAMIGALATEDVSFVEDNSVLELDMSKNIIEREATDVERIFSQEKTMGMNTILKAIENAATDKKIKGIYLKMGMSYNAGWSETQEIRQALENFKKSGKFIYAYSDNYTTKSYFLATIADSIYLNPSGMVEFAGISAETMFIKDLLNKLDVNVELIRPNNNAYKSAGEMYILDKMSEANKEQVRTYIMSIWNEVLPIISKARDISVADLNKMADNLSAFLANDAQKSGLIDVLGFEADLNNIIAKRINENDVSDINFASLSDYAVSMLDMETSSENKIAVVYAEGDVQMGKGYDVAVYSENITNALDEAADDDDVKAIVLRVNSPGGAVTASEIITNAVRRAKAKKPVIVSMSDLAASAGYEISCYATKIVAMPTTITGSIGVFATIPEVGSMLKNKLGITFDTVNTNANSSALSLTRPLSPTSRALLARNVEEFYTTFCSRVAEGRGLSVTFVDSIARGRVWTGKDALKLGLVDTLGGMDLAIKIAAAEAHIKNYEVENYSSKMTSWTQLFEFMDEDARAKALIPSQYGKYQFFHEMEKFSNAEPLQARLPYFINL